MRANKQRWYQFGLRGLAIIIALIAGPLAWLSSHYHVKEQRWAVIRYFGPTIYFTDSPMPPLSLGQRLVGDCLEYPEIAVRVASPEGETQLAELRRLFPKSEIRVTRAP